MATLAVRKCIDMPHKKGAIAMRDQFHLNLTRYERLNAKPVEHQG